MPLFIFLLGLDQCLKGPLSLFCSMQNSDFSHLYRLVCITTTGDPAEKFSFGAFPPEGAFGSQSCGTVRVSTAKSGRDMGIKTNREVLFSTMDVSRKTLAWANKEVEHGPIKEDNTLLKHAIVM